MADKEPIGEETGLAKKIIETMGDGLIVTDLEGKITSVNRAFLELEGLEEKEVIGKSAIEYFAPENKSKYEEFMEKIMENGNAGPIEATGITKDGKEVATLVSASLLRDAENKPTALFAVVRDITERKEAEEKFKTVIQNSTSAIYIFQDGKLKFVNDTFERLSGYTKEELMDIEYLDLIHPEFRDMMKEATEQALTGDTSNIPPEPEFKIIRKDGEVIWMRLIPTLIEYNGRTAILGNAINITAQKKLQAERMKSSIINITSENVSGGVIREFGIRTSSHELGIPDILRHWAELSTDPPPQNLFNLIITGTLKTLKENGVKTDKKKVQEVLTPLIRNFLREVFSLAKEFYMDIPPEYREFEKKLSQK